MTHPPSQTIALDWLIIGAGIHGVHLAIRLLAEAGVPHARLGLLDPASRPLDAWRRCTAATGMRYLRSPAVHHLDLDPWSLQHFAGKKRKQKEGLFAPPYDRPALSLFHEHCEVLLTRYGLPELHCQDRAVTLEPGPQGVRVLTAHGRVIEAQRVALALGASAQPAWPVWAQELLAQDASLISHMFCARFDPYGLSDVPPSAQRVAVIGAGISAAQLSARLVKRGLQVALISRHDLREAQFDSDPGWLGPRKMESFTRQRDPDARRALIDEARQRGSMSPDVRRDLTKLIAQGQVGLHLTQVQLATPDPEGGVRLWTSGGELHVDHVILATGFEVSRPGGAMIDALVRDHALPCARCGYPVVDRALRWHERVFVSGPLAELELGPVSRNISGARRAGERLSAHLRGAA